MDRSELFPRVIGPLVAGAVLCLVVAWTVVLVGGLVLQSAARWLTDYQ